MSFTRDQITVSLKTFTRHRDAVMHEDESTFHSQLKRFWLYVTSDQVAKDVVQKVPQLADFDTNEWWRNYSSENNYRNPQIIFPESEEGEFFARYKIIESVVGNEQHVLTFGFMYNKRKTDESINLFRSLILRPFMESLGDRLSHATNLVSPQERDLQAVPFYRLPKQNEVNIFLSHKSADKVLVQRYYDVLKELGYSPWLDNPNMPAGSNLERALLQGFQESCAVVFFITDNFRDENYLATEVDYAIRQKRQKEKKFAIITLVFPPVLRVPDLLDPYVYKQVTHELQGLHEIIRALPIELGPIRWKLSVTE
jgi:hypothetical protein